MVWVGSGLAFCVGVVAMLWLTFDVVRAADDGGLSYLDFRGDAPMVSHVIAFDERPLSAHERNGRRYVTTDHGLGVVHPPCPAP